jgi:hypothetical protein
MMKIKWKVSSKPTGSYASFHRRGWPHAYFEGDKMAAQILCADDYHPPMVKAGTHGPLTIWIADYSIVPTKEKPSTWTWCKLVKTAATLQEVKERVEAFYKHNPQMLPKEDDD